MKPIFKLLIAVLLTVGIAGAANAATYTYGDEDGKLLTTLTEENSLNFGFVIDDNVSLEDITSMQLTVYAEGIDWSYNSTSSFYFEIANVAISDSFSEGMSTGADTYSNWIIDTSLLTTDTNGDLCLSGTITLTVLSVGASQASSVYDQTVDITGAILEVKTAAAPTPASLLFLGTGLAVLARVRRHRA